MHIISNITIPLLAIRGLVQTPCEKINIVIILLTSPPPHVTAVQHRFNTETPILLHLLAYMYMHINFGVHLYSTVL